MPDFKPSSDFISNLGKRLDLQISDNVFSAMDYHIDWIYASLQLSDDNDENKIHPNTNNVIKA